MTAVPSQLMPEKPVVTLSITPSRTDVITTSTKTPSISSVSVSVERSLWAHSSRSPPRTTSRYKARRVPVEWPRRSIGAVPVNGNALLLKRTSHSRFQIPRAPEEEIPESGVKTSEGFRTWNLESGIWNLLITERLHWRLPAGLEGRVEREDEPEEAREQEGPEEALRVHVEGDLENGRDDLGERDPDREPEHRAEAREEHRLRHELLEDLPA